MSNKLHLYKTYYEGEHVASYNFSIISTPSSNKLGIFKLPKDARLLQTGNTFKGPD